jgi:hypothetical protein
MYNYIYASNLEYFEVHQLTLRVNVLLCPYILCLIHLNLLHLIALKNINHEVNSVVENLNGQCK